MTDPIYDHIGRVYNASRRAEPAVVKCLVDLLGLPRGSVLADIGAGTGNYSSALAEAGYLVHAIEPSAEMRSQARAHPGVRWLAGRAEDLPLADRSAQGVVSTLAIHHFDSLAGAASEMHRICPAGPVVIYTMDPRQGEDFWFGRYFPAIFERVFSVFPPLNQVCRTLGHGTDWKLIVKEFPLPRDSVDMTMHSGWSRPEIYLDETFRRNTSGFALAEAGEVAAGLAALRRDLKSGEWDQRYGHLRREPSLDLGFRFLCFA